MYMFQKWGRFMHALNNGACRLYHHSASRGKYYSNRLYMKKCPKCGACNSCGVLKCVGCMHDLCDGDIRLRTLDLICKGANARRHETDLQQQMLYRNFDFTIMNHPHKCALIHLCALPNGTFYDIKNLRPSHVPMLEKMKLKSQQLCLEIIKDKILQGEIQCHVSSADSACKTPESDVAPRLLELLTCGFNYPNAFTHVDMHVIVPPVFNFQTFTSPYYYPLNKVIQDLKTFKRVRSYSKIEIAELLSEDKYTLEMQELHQKALKLIQTQGNFT